MMDENGVKWIRVERLKKLLIGLSDNSEVCVNAVGNLLVRNDNKSIGFIDFLAEEVELFERRRNESD